MTWGGTKMRNRQYWSILVLAVLGGFGGGALASRLFTVQPVFAEKKAKPAAVIEAQEFRLVDTDGKTGARLTIQNGKIFAEIPDLTEWRVKLLGERK